MKCPACGSSSLTPLEFQVFSCRNCGAAFNRYYTYSEKPMNTESEEPKIVIGSHQYSLEESYAIEFAKRKIQIIRDEIYDELFGKLKTLSLYEDDAEELNYHLNKLIKYINE